METNKQLPIAKAGEELKTPVKVNLLVTNIGLVTNKETEEPLIRIELEGEEGVILRTFNQAKADLSDFYTKEQLENATSTFIKRSYERYFLDRTIGFVGSYHEKGAIQTVDEKSKLYTNGLQEIGAKVETQTSGIWVEGFLSVKLTDAELDAIIERELNAMAKVSQAEKDLVP